MKKSLQIFFLLLAALITGTNGAWADEVTGTITFGNSNVKINAASVTGDDSQDNTWTITTEGTTSFTGNTTYYQVGSGKSPATSITFTTTLSEDVNITSFSAKFGGFSGTQGDVKLKVGDTEVGSGSLNASSDVTVSSTSSATGKVLTVTVTSIAKGVKAYYISYTYTTGGSTPVTQTVAVPAFSPAAGTYTTAQSVSLNCATEGATIYYTTDGSEPSTESSVYESEISVTTGMTIKAIAVKDDMENSSVAEAVYVIKPSAPTFAVNNGNVTLASAEGTTVYYTTDGTEPTSESTEYSSPFDVESGTTVKTIAVDANGNKSDVAEQTVTYFVINAKNIGSNYFTKVTDASQLEDGDAIVIVYGNKAMSTTQKSNNRGAADVTVSDGAIDGIAADVQKIVLVSNGENWLLFAGDGYLYAASSSDNYLRTEAEADDNANAEITFDEGIASVEFQGSNSRSSLRYNSSNKLFSCYSSTSDMKAVEIYKEVERPIATTTITLNEACTDGELVYGTFSSEKPFVVSDDIIVSEVAVIDGELWVESYETGDVVPANIGVMVSAFEAGDYEVVCSNEAGESVLKEDNCLRATGNEGITANQMSFADPGCTYYRLTMHNGTQIGYWWGAENGDAFDIAPNKAYLAVPATVANNARSFWFGGDATGINAVEKKVENGVVYDLQGRRVTAPVRGLYIVNGKKVVIK